MLVSCFLQSISSQQQEKKKKNLSTFLSILPKVSNIVLNRSLERWHPCHVSDIINISSNVLSYGSDGEYQVVAIYLFKGIFFSV